MKFWQPTQKLQGPVFSYGRTGSGKTWHNIAIVGLYHSKYKYKVWDIAPGKGNESGFWCFPSDQIGLWKTFQNKVGFMSSLGAKEYKIKLLIPCFNNKLMNKEVPQLLPRIRTQIFSIYFKDITIEDISVILGDVSKNSIHFWNSIINNLPSSSTGIDIENYIDKHLKKYKELSIYKSFIKPAIDNYLLCSKDCPNKLDLVNEAKDKETISILLHEYMLDKKWSMFIMNYIMRKLLFDLASSEKIHRNNIAIFREAGDYMKIVDKSAESGEQTQIFRNNITNVARYGRRGLILFLDTQSPKDVKNLIEGQEDLLCINEISSLEISEIVGKLRMERRMSKKIRDNLHNLKRDQIVIVERQQKAVWINSFMPPRCMCYTNKSFLKTWEEKYNSYKKSIEDIKFVIEENEKSIEKFNRISQERIEKINEVAQEKLRIKNKVEEQLNEDEEDDVLFIG